MSRLNDIRSAMLAAFGFGDFAPMGIMADPQRKADVDPATPQSESERLMEAALKLKAAAETVARPADQFTKTLEQFGADL